VLFCRSEILQVGVAIVSKGICPPGLSKNGCGAPWLRLQEEGSLDAQRRRQRKEGTKGRGWVRRKRKREKGELPRKKVLKVVENVDSNVVTAAFSRQHPLQSFFLLSPFSPSLFLRQMDQSLKSCCVCHEFLCDPVRNLPCLHSACLACLDQWISHSRPFEFFHLNHPVFTEPPLLRNNELSQAPFKCPVCRSVFEIIPTTVPAAVPAVVERRRGKGKQAVASAAEIAIPTISASSLPVNLCLFHTGHSYFVHFWVFFFFWEKGESE